MSMQTHNQAICICLYFPELDSQLESDHRPRGKSYEQLYRVKFTR